jgi:hypothetical protein
MDIVFHNEYSEFATSFLAQEGAVWGQAFTNEGPICLFQNGDHLVGFHEYPKEIVLLAKDKDEDPTNYKAGMNVVYADGVRTVA